MIIAKSATFSGRRASFSEVTYEGTGTEIFDPPREAVADDIDVIVACTGYKTDFSWLDVPGLDWNPRTWFKHCFPKGHGDRLMFLGWAGPHQGGIPPAAEMLARYIALLLDGSRTLPADYADRAKREGADEDAYYRSARHQVDLHRAWPAAAEVALEAEVPDDPLGAHTRPATPIRGRAQAS